MDPSTHVLKPPQDQALITRRSPTGGRRGARGTAARAGQWHRDMSASPPPCSGLWCISSLAGLVLRNEKGEERELQILKARRPDPSPHQPLPALHIPASRWARASSFT